MPRTGAAEKPRIMLVGNGNLTANLLSLLLLDPRTDRLVLAGRDLDACRRRANLARFAAHNLGSTAAPDVVALDLRDVDRTGETLATVKPDIIFMGATLQSWRRITELPKHAFEALDAAQFGPWLPMHLTLNHLLMRAVRQSGLPVRTVNAAFPDAVGPVLAKLGLAPTVGIGNVANIVPALTCSAASLLGVDVERVRIRLVAQHYFSHHVPRFGGAGRGRYALSIRVDGAPHPRPPPDEAIFAQLAGPLKRLGGVDGQLLTASSAARVVQGLAADVPTEAHAPSPGGLPGGYPVRLDRHGVSVDLDPGMSLEEAVAINEDCQRADGIDTIAEDGTVTFAEPEMAVMTKLMGYRCRTMAVADAAGWAEELGQKYSRFAASFNPVA